jgi:hypothetical protein
METGTDDDNDNEKAAVQEDAGSCRRSRELEHSSDTPLLTIADGAPGRSGPLVVGEGVVTQRVQRRTTRPRTTLTTRPHVHTSIAIFSSIRLLPLLTHSR